MLPFLKDKKEASVAVPSDTVKRDPDEPNEEFDMLESAADELIAAIHAKDSKAVASALRSAFQIADSEPHEEGPHE